jgi:hypothetical protein
MICCLLHKIFTSKRVRLAVNNNISKSSNRSFCFNQYKGYAMKKNNSPVVSSQISLKPKAPSLPPKIADITVLPAVYSQCLLPEPDPSLREGRVLSYMAIMGSYLPAILLKGVSPVLFSSDKNVLRLSMSARNAVFTLMEQMKDRNLGYADHPLQSIVMITCYSKKDQVKSKNTTPDHDFSNRAVFYSEEHADATHIIGGIIEIRRVAVASATVKDLITTRDSTIRKMPIHRFSYQLKSHYGSLSDHLSHKTAVGLGFAAHVLRDGENNTTEFIANGYLDSVLWFGYNRSSDYLTALAEKDARNDNSSDGYINTKYLGVRSIRNRNIYKTRYKRLSLVL